MSEDDNTSMSEATTPHAHHRSPYHDEPLLQNSSTPATPPSPTTAASATLTTSEPPPPSYHNDISEPDVEAARNSRHGYDHDDQPPLPPNFRAPTNRLTRPQILQMVLVDGIGSAILGAGINFGIAYAMYAKITNLKTSPIRLFEFPNTLAGDGGLTIFIQCLLTWFWELWVLNASLKRGKGIPALASMREPRANWLRWFFFLPLDDHHSPEDSNDDGQGSRSSEERGGREEANDNEKPKDAAVKARWAKVDKWLKFLAGHLIRVVIIAFVCFVVMWPPSVGILTTYGHKKVCPVTDPKTGDKVPGIFKHVGMDEAGGPGCMTDWYFYRSWAPEIFKAVQGAVLGVLVTPLMCLFWLVRCGWALRRGEGRYGARVDG